MPERLVKWGPGSELGAVGSAGSATFIPSSVPQFCPGKEANNVVGPFSYFHAWGMAVRCFKGSTARVKSNMRVKLENVEVEVSDVKQTGLWNKSVHCCSRTGGKPENKRARKTAEK